MSAVRFFDSISSLSHLDVGRQDQGECSELKSLQAIGDKIIKMVIRVTQETPINPNAAGGVLFFSILTGLLMIHRNQGMLSSNQNIQCKISIP